MTYTYEWADAEEYSLRRTDEAGNVAFVPVAEGNRDYAEFVASGAVATAYVAPAYVAPGPTELELLTARIETLEAKVQTLETDHTTLMNNDNNNNGGY